MIVLHEFTILVETPAVHDAINCGTRQVHATIAVDLAFLSLLCGPCQLTLLIMILIILRMDNFELHN